MHMLHTTRDKTSLDKSSYHCVVFQDKTTSYGDVFNVNYLREHSYQEGLRRDSLSLPTFSAGDRVQVMPWRGRDWYNATIRRRSTNLTTDGQHLYQVTPAEGHNNRMRQQPVPAHLIRSVCWADYSPGVQFDGHHSQLAGYRKVHPAPRKRKRVKKSTGDDTYTRVRIPRALVKLVKKIKTLHQQGHGQVMRDLLWSQLNIVQLHIARFNSGDVQGTFPNFPTFLYS